MAVALLPALTPYLATAGIGWLYYRRIRRSFGRQSWHPRRTMARLVLVSLVAVALVFAAIYLPHTGLGIGIGALLGSTLGGFGLKHTHAQLVDGQRYYTPNPWIGGALSVLLLGRLAWRWSQGAFIGGASQSASWRRSISTTKRRRAALRPERCRNSWRPCARLAVSGSKV
jgi:hypothetical protein